VKYTLKIPLSVLSTIPSPSTRLTVASLYTLPLVVLKSSENASDANRSAKINAVAPLYFTWRILPLFISIRQRQNDMNRAHGWRSTFNNSAPEVPQPTGGHLQSAPYPWPGSRCHDGFRAGGDGCRTERLRKFTHLRTRPPRSGTPRNTFRRTAGVRGNIVLPLTFESRSLRASLI